jgi:hypothetical protein
MLRDAGIEAIGSEIVLAAQQFELPGPHADMKDALLGADRTVAFAHVDCSGSTRTRNRTRPQWQPHLYVCSLPCPRGAPVISGRGYSFWGSPTYLRFFSWPDRFHQPGARQTEVAPWAHPRQRAGTEGYVTEALSEPRGALRASKSSARRS